MSDTVSTGAVGGHVADDPWAPNEADIERRKRELLDGARREVGDVPPGKAPGSRGDGPGPMVGIGVQFVVTILVCLFAGQWLDRRLGTAPWMMLAGMLLGAGVGLWTMLRVARSQDGGK